MSRVDDLIREAEELDSPERVRLLQRLLQLALRDVRQQAGNRPGGVERTDAVCGGDACIAGTRIPVWVLDRMRRLGASEADILRSYPSLRAQDLVDAWSYAGDHSDEIERLIRENEGA